MSRWKTVSAVVGSVCAGLVLVVSSAMLAFPAISEIAGLAVAQSNTNWNSVIDASKGDGQTQGILGTATYLYDGATFNRIRGDIANGMDVDVTRISGTITPADAFANPTTANTMWSLGGVFNGTTWDRVRSATGDGVAATGLQAASNVIFNGSTWDRLRTASGDNLAATGISAAGNVSFDGANWDRVLGVSNTNNTATTSSGVRYSTQLSTWSVIDTDAGATQATASRAAGGGTVRHVATGVTICRGDTSAAAPALIHLRDGATGAGTILRSWVIGVAAGLSQCLDVTGLNMTGSANTAMTLEFAAAGAATSTSTVTLTGYSTP